MDNNIFSMGDTFSVSYAREEFIKKLKAKGYTKEEIKNMVEIADKMYNENKIPYPDNF